MCAATVRVNVQRNEWEEVLSQVCLVVIRTEGGTRGAESGRYGEKDPGTKEYGSDEEKYSSSG